MELGNKGEWQRDLAMLERATAAECYRQANDAETMELKRNHVLAAELHAEAADLCTRLADIYDRLDSVGSHTRRSGPPSAP